MRGRWIILLVSSLLITALAAWEASGLRIETRLLALLPDTAPAAAAYRSYLERFGGIRKVEVVLTPAGLAQTGPGGERPRPAGPEDLAAAAELLAGILPGRPGVAAARAGLTPEDEEFVSTWVLPRLALLPAANAEDVRDRLDPDAAAGRARRLRRLLLGPMGGLRARLARADPLGLAGDGLLPGGGALGLLDPVTGAFLAPDGRAALVLVQPVAGELEPAAGRVLQATLDAACAEVTAQVGAGLDCHTAGGPLYAAEDEAIIRADIMRTVAGAGLAVTLVLMVFLRGVVLPASLVLTVLAGVLWTGGTVQLLQGGVSVMGVAFGAILLGLGVDYGIHGAVRFRQERLAGAAPAAAVAAVLRLAGPAILASAATTAAGFLVLSRADFPPVAELGSVVAAGVAAILLATLAVGAPALVVGAGLFRRPPAREGAAWRLTGRGVEALVGLAGRRPLPVLAGAGVLSLASLAGLARLEFSGDLRVLRPEGRASERTERLLAEHFDWGRDSFTVLVSGRDLDEALDRSRAVQAGIAGRLPGAQVTGPGDWLTGGKLQRHRVAELAGPRAAAGVQALRRELDAAGFRLEPLAPALRTLEEIAAGEVPAAVPPERWPDWLGELIRVDAQGAAAAVQVRASGIDWAGRAGENLLAVVAAAAPGAQVAAVPRLGVELQALAGTEFVRLSGWAGLLVGAVILVSFRGRPRPALAAVLPVSAGCLWTLGLCGAAGWSLNPVSAAVASLLLGIGIDDGLHAVHARRYTPDPAAAVRAVGRPMVLTTLTTCLGFGSLALSRMPALRQAGLLVALGTVLCLAATLLVLPAVAALGGRAEDLP